jgi:transposase
MSKTRWPRDLNKERLWRQRLQRWQRSGLTARAFCQREQLRESALYFWKREIARRDCEQPEQADTAPKHRARAARARFVPVTIAAAPTPTTTVEIVLRAGRTVRVGPGFDPALLRAVVSALETQPC